MRIQSERRPFYLKYSLLILCLLTLIVYFKVSTLGFTDLDDKFFILKNESFNSDLGNIPVTFGRGLFGPANDLYYRPLLLVDFIVEYTLFGTDPRGYHLTNLLFHTLTVCLLFLFFKKIRTREEDALILAALFAIHPVLSQAVAWIPGRNDMLLMIFFLGTILSSIKYQELSDTVNQGKLKKPNPLARWGWFTAQFIFLLLALFTKETAVVIPLIVISILFILKRNNVSPCHPVTLSPIIISNSLAIAIFFLFRSSATLLNEPTSFVNLLSTGLSRIPAMIQYVGKILLPVNLSVFPLMEDTAMGWGIGAVIALVLLVIFSKSYFRPLTLLGLGWFLIFLAPVLIVPKSLNDQVFEHRLYIPIAGMLILLSQTLLFAEKWNSRTKMIIATGIIVLLGAVSFSRIGLYKDEDVFWRRAITDAPHAVMPKMMLVNGTTLTPAEREEIRRSCYTLDPGQMMVHYTLGKIYMQLNQPDSAERHFKLELPLSQFPDIYYQLAMISAGKKRFDSTLLCLNKVIELDPGHANVPKIQEMILEMQKQFYMEKAQAAVRASQPDTAAVYLLKLIAVDPMQQQAHHNLVILYLQTNQKDKAIDIINQMKAKGLTLAPEFLKISQEK
jgi:hypothetical protein